jgi:hypothetical protein
MHIVKRLLEHSCPKSRPILYYYDCDRRYYNCRTTPETCEGLTVIYTLVGGDAAGSEIEMEEDIAETDFWRGVTMERLRY